MFKFGTIGAFKQVRNNPRCKATRQLKNGMVVIPNDTTGTAPTPANASAAQGLGVYVVNNIIDKPEILNKKDFVVEVGEYVRAFRLEDLKDLPVEIDADVVREAYASVAVGDILVPANDTMTGHEGKWVKADGTTIVANTYKVNLKVLEKTTFGDQGFYCQVVIN